jgi:hypothetical protein
MWWWIACTPDLLVPTAEALTDDGAYVVALPSDTWGQGPAALRLAISNADDGPAEGLAVTLQTRMPDMAHENEALMTVEEDGGLYAADAWFSMPGLWLVDVDADGSPAELVVSVE